jgi:hypothetical protein
MHVDGVSLGEQLVELTPILAAWPAGVVNHAHTEGLGPVRDRLADSAEANDSKRRAAHVAAEEVGIGPAPTPAAVAHRAIADDDASSHRQQ